MMEPTSHLDSAKVYAFPSGGRAAATAQKADEGLGAMGVAKSPVGAGWYHEAAMHEAEHDLQPRELPWWAEAEHESRAKDIVRPLF